MIVIISDTHENTPLIDEAVPKIQALSPELVIHCGDIVSPKVLDHFRGLPMRFVFGNNDFEREALRRRAGELGFGSIEDELILSLYEKDLYVTHGTRASTVEQTIDSQVYDYVFHGHTHLRRNEKIGRTRVINPGALYRARVYSFATLDLQTDVVEFHQL